MSTQRDVLAWSIASITLYGQWTLVAKVFDIQSNDPNKNLLLVEASEMLAKDAITRRFTFYVVTFFLKYLTGRFER